MTGCGRGVAIAVLAVVVAACSPGVAAPPAANTPTSRTFSPLFDGAAPLADPDYTDDGPGSLISMTPLEGSEELEGIDAKYLRVVYRSTSGIDGSPTETSGIVAVPAGTPPQGGWPVISFGHGTTGVLTKCAPSNFGTMVGNGTMMAAMITNGFAVTSADYQGLGVPGYYHPFLDAQTFGNNMIDAVRAARRVDAGISNRWIAFGHSLGGMAAWAAADRAGAYGGGLDLVGTLSMAPAADMSGLADKAWNETLTPDQRIAMVYALQSLSWSNPDLDLDRYRSGYTAERWDDILDCLPPEFDDTAKVRAGMKNSDLKPASMADTDRLRRLLEARALPQSPQTGPMMVIYGTEDTLVDVAWTEKAIDRACAAGAVLQIDKRIGEGHGDLDSAVGLPWMRDVMNGMSVPDTCAIRQ